jgi:hypothetical protein
MELMLGRIKYRQAETLVSEPISFEVEIAI